MTDGTPPLEPLRPLGTATPRDAGAPAGAPEGPGRARPAKHPARRARVAAVGLGVAAMVGLVSNMEVAGSRAKTGDLATASVPPSARPARGHPRPAWLPAKASSSPRPIVLTPHAVVHTVAAPASSGSSGYAYTAAPAAAPVASTGGSH